LPLQIEKFDDKTRKSLEKVRPQGYKEKRNVKVILYAF